MIFGKEVKFETYASLRIRGTILDQIRKMDWIPRTVRQKQKKIDEAIKQVEMRTGKNASDEEIAQELGLSEAFFPVRISTCLIASSIFRRRTYHMAVTA